MNYHQYCCIHLSSVLLHSFIISTAAFIYHQYCCIHLSSVLLHSFIISTAAFIYHQYCCIHLSSVLLHSSEEIIIRRSEDNSQRNKIKNCIFKITSRSVRDQWVNSLAPGKIGGEESVDMILLAGRSLRCVSRPGSLWSVMWTNSYSVSESIYRHPRNFNIGCHFDGYWFEFTTSWQAHASAFSCG